MHVCRCLQSLEHCVRSPEAGVAGDCELSDTLLGAALGASEREVHLLNH